MIFRYIDYRKFLNEIKKRGKTQLFKKWYNEKVFLIRHDVDFDISLAYELALIEKEENVISTFFILISSSHYNVLNSNNRRLLKEILYMGHEIGLHFDPSLYNENIDFYFEKEVEILNFAIGQKINSISLHNPSVHGTYPLFKNYVNAYDPKLFNDQNYLSDSRMLFSKKNPYKFLDKIDNSMLQILLHPMHYSLSGKGYDYIMSKIIKKKIYEIHDSFKVNSTYVKDVGNDLFAVVKKFK